MAVNSLHQQYSESLPAWRKCRDTFNGSDEVKAKGDLYLPRLTAQTSLEYEAYKSRALFYNAMARTVQGLLGGVFRKDPVIVAPDVMAPILEDATLTGIDFVRFARGVFQEVLTVGRHGVLVEMPAEAEPDPRPWLVGYNAEQIINWATTRWNGKIELSLVVIEEPFVEERIDQFSVKWGKQYRVLELIDGKYQVSIYRVSEKDSRELALAEQYFPTFRGRQLEYIPFEFFLTVDVERPMLLDLVDVNLSHYRTSADLEHGRHFTALPTPWVAGFTADRELRIGSATAWVASDPSARAGMLEFSGAGLGALERALEEKETKMAALGARILEQQKMAAEAAETVKLRRAGEVSVLQAMAVSGSISFTNVMKWAAEWMGLNPDDVSVELNTEFFDTTMTPAELQQQVLLWQAGGIAWDTLYANLQKGGITREGVTAEEEKALIEEATAALPPPTLPNPNQNDQAQADQAQGE